MLCSRHHSHGERQGQASVERVANRRFRRREVTRVARGRLPFLPSRQQQHVSDTRVRALDRGPTVPGPAAEHVPATRVDGAQPSGDF